VAVSLYNSLYRKSHMDLPYGFLFYPLKLGEIRQFFYFLTRKCQISFCIFDFEIFKN